MSGTAAQKISETTEARRRRKAPDAVESLKPAARQAADSFSQTGLSGASIQTSTGRSLQVFCAIERIINIKRGVQVATRITPTVVEAYSHRRLWGRDRAQLDSTELLEIDRLVLGFGVPLLKDRRYWPVIVPISFQTMSRTRARYKLFASAGAEPEEIREVVIGEVVGMDAGTPEGRLRDAVALVRAHCCGVFMEAPTSTALSWLPACPVTGVSLDCRDMRGDDEALTAGLQAFAGIGAYRASTVVARGLPSEAFLEIADEAGVTHASVRGDTAISDVDHEEAA